MKNKVRVGLIIIGVVITINISLVFSMGSRVEKDEKENVVGEKNKDNAISQNGKEGKVQYEEYVPEVLIEGKWGKGPGEFWAEYLEPLVEGWTDVYQPESIAVKGIFIFSMW
jgi:hypothetical protein